MPSQVSIIGFGADPSLERAKHEIANPIHNRLINGGFDLNEPGEGVPEWARDHMVTRFDHRDIGGRLDAYAVVRRANHSPWNATRIEIAFKNREGLFHEHAFTIDDFLRPHLIHGPDVRRPVTLVELKDYFQITP